MFATIGEFRGAHDATEYGLLEELAFDRDIMLRRGRTYFPLFPACQVRHTSDS